MIYLCIYILGNRPNLAGYNTINIMLPIKYMLLLIYGYINI